MKMLKAQFQVQKASKGPVQVRTRTMLHFLIWKNSQTITAAMSSLTSA